MAGFWHLSHHQMRDPNGAVYAGAKANFYESDGLTRITIYQDYGLGTPHANPVEANSSGIFPPVFFDEDDDFYRQRITTADGVIIPGTDVGTLPIIGPTGGGGGSEVPVDENALFQTGMPTWLPISGTKAGWVRYNARTIGSATSGATERANADCEALFLYLWATFSDTLCPVTGGRGISAAADWAANKAIATLDMRNKGPFGLPDMGNTDTGEFSSTTFDVGSATAAASQGGDARVTLAIADMPAHDHGGVTGNPTTHPNSGATSSYAQADSGGNFLAVSLSSNAGTLLPDHVHTVASQGGGGAHNNMPPFMLGTWYGKL